MGDFRRVELPFSTDTATGNDTTLDHFFYAPAPNQSLTAFNIGGWFMARPQAAGAALGELVVAVASGAIRPPALHTLPLAQAAQAHRQMEARQTSGKLVLKPWH